MRRTILTILAALLTVASAAPLAAAAERHHARKNGRAAVGEQFRNDAERNAGIASMLKAGASWSAIQQATGCSRATIAKLAKRAA